MSKGKIVQGSSARYAFDGNDTKILPTSDIRFLVMVHILPLLLTSRENRGMYGWQVVESSRLFLSQSATNATVDPISDCYRLECFSCAPECCACACGFAGLSFAEIAV